MRITKPKTKNVTHKIALHLFINSILQVADNKNEEPKDRVEKTKKEGKVKSDKLLVCAEAPRMNINTEMKYLRLKSQNGIDYNNFFPRSARL